MDVRVLSAVPDQSYVALRQRALREEPEAFITSPEEDQARQAAVHLGPAVHGTRCMLGGFLEGQLIGMSGFVRESRAKARHKATLVAVYVAPEFRRRGYAYRLIAATLANLFSAAEIKSVKLTVSEGNSAAIRLYEELGFVAWGVEPDGMRLNGRSVSKVHMQLSREAWSAGRRGEP